MTSKNTKRALLTSVLSILMCVSMLVGTTFAWFTDTASTNVNTIQAGTLDVDIVDGDGKSLDGLSLSFVNSDGSTNILWEPGVTFYTTSFKIVNNGNLALKYESYLNGVRGDNKLLEAIDFSIVDENGQDVTSAAFLSGVLLPEEATGAYRIKGHMKESAGNAYQGLSLTGLSISVVATQTSYEYDSTDNTYDNGANYNVVNTVEALAEAVSHEGATVVLNSDMALNGALTLAKGVSLYGNGHTISGYPVSAGADTIIKNVVLVDPTNDNDNASHLYCGGSIIVDGCTFKGSQWDSIQFTPNAGDEIVINNCSFTDSTQRFIHIEAKPNYQENDVKITITNNYFGDDSALHDDTIGLYFVKLDSIDFGGNNLFETKKANAIYICGATTALAITSDEAFERFGGYGLTAMPNAPVSGDVSLIENVTGAAQNTSNALSGYNAGIALKKGVLDGNGNTLTAGRADVGVEIAEGTIKNLTVTNAWRGIMTYSTTGDIIIENVVIDGCGYAINTGAGTTNACSLIVKKSVLNGWSSWDNVNAASFTECSFGTSTYYTNEAFQHLVRPYVTTTFADCDFEEGFYIQLDKLSGTVTLNNCTCDGVVLTNANFADYVKIVTGFDSDDNAIYARNGDTLTNVIFS